MRDRGQLIIGAVLVLLGLMFLFSTVFQVDLWPFCWSIGLIALGVWLVLRPRLAGPDASSEVMLLGELHRNDRWEVRNEEFWLGVGEMELDLTQAVIPPGETTLRIYSFVTEVKILAPKTVGVAVRAIGFVSDTKLFGQNNQAFLVPVEAASDGYAAAESRLRVEMTGFVTNLKVRQV